MWQLESSVGTDAYARPKAANCRQQLLARVARSVRAWLQVQQRISHLLQPQLIPMLGVISEQVKQLLKQLEVEPSAFGLGAHAIDLLSIQLAVSKSPLPAGVALQLHFLF